MKAIDYGNLIRAITYNMNDYVANACKAIGIGPGQFEYFLLIAQHPGINHLDLARQKNVGKGSVTNAVKKLERDGFITRVADEYDKRQSNCYLSADGEKVLPKLIEISDAIENQLFDAFEEEEKDLLYQLLQKLEYSSSQLI